MEVDSWVRLGQALRYYTSNGCKYVEVPWIVSPKTSAITKPVHCQDYYHGSSHVLVASAEQSFIELYPYCKDGGGIFVACTPCFRDEDYLDRTHQMYFHKVELFSTDPTQLEMVGWLAKNFFENTLGYRNKVDRLDTSDDTFDLMYRDIELGSYGIRTHEDKTWVYGTGLAEPRMTVALQIKDERLAARKY
jgi:hypothetical protein